ncbi:hypothetical protein [Pedobacter sp.]|uniref:hypothetical protein n=1 Tax=Pedobacter sp. TaxID=1411316 RepID=UPI003C495DA6
MKRLNLEIKNPEPILRSLNGLFSEDGNPEQQLLRLPAQQDYENPLRMEVLKNAIGMKQVLLPEILHAFGIRAITLDKSHDLKKLQEIAGSLDLTQREGARDYFKDPELVTELKALFRKSSTIAFDDWGSFPGGVSVWRDLFKEVIQPLHRFGVEFIFYLGNPAQKPSYQVGEILEIISEFTKVGEVTLALDEMEALNLWRWLNGVDASVDLGPSTIVNLKKKYHSIFLTTDFSRLLVYSANDAMLFSSNDQFVLSRKLVEAKVEIGDNARLNFISGYSAGLHLGVGIAQSIALGLIIFGASGVYNTFPDRKAIEDYISAWIADLEKPETINLYQ